MPYNHTDYTQEKKSPCSYAGLFSDLEIGNDYMYWNRSTLVNHPLRNLALLPATPA
jgi:hypothetical protein